MPSGTSFCFAGGIVVPGLRRRPRRVGPAAAALRVFAQRHFRFRVHRNLQRFRLLGDLLLNGPDVGEDRIRVFGFLQRLAFAHGPQPIVHAIQNAPHRPFAGEVIGRVVLLIPQRREHFGGRKIRVPSRGLEFRIGLGVRFDERTNVGGALRVDVLPAGAPPGRKILADRLAGATFLQSFRNRVASPAKASFGLPRLAVTEDFRDLGNERPMFRPLQTLCGRADQGLMPLQVATHSPALPGCGNRRIHTPGE
jgi:hypothetical protein